MRVLFAGSPDIAVPSLESLLALDGIQTVAVITNPDAPKGRRGEPVPTDVALAAAKADIPVLKPEKLDSQAREQLAAFKPDLLVSFAYGRLFGPKFMALFPLGGINIHPSLLPKYRGPSPIQAAILNRDSETGISIQSIAPQMDSGDILACERFPLTGRETADSLGASAARTAALMLPDVLKGIKEGGIKGEPQNHGEATYCSLITKDQGIIDWKQGAAQIEAKIRAFDPWPLCRTIHKGKYLFILEADVFKGAITEFKPNSAGIVLRIDKQDGILIQTGEGVLAVRKLQYQAKKALFWRDFINGVRDFPGSQLG
jgi:methionyl-tRNA formyltransferase